MRNWYAQITCNIVRAETCKHLKSDLFADSHAWNWEPGLDSLSHHCHEFYYMYTLAAQVQRVGCTIHIHAQVYMHVFPTPQDITVAGVENDISQTLLQISYVTSRLKRLQQTLDEQQESLQKQNELISHSDVEITRNNALVERKQTQIDQMNKKINQKLSKMEGVSVTVTVHN